MKKTILSGVLTFLTLWCYGQSVNETTDYFEFYNNYWVNLHHFLYQKAKGSQLNKLKEDGFDFLPIGEDTVILNLNKSESAVLEKAIEYYQVNLINKELRRDLGQMRVWLQQQDEEYKITDTVFSQEFTIVLNNASEVYKPKLWPIHKAQNQKVLDNQIETIRLLESRVINEMEKLSQYKWPDSTKVRIDLTVYANYAGAYTVTTPQMNIIISTIDPLNVTTSFVETIFHEGTHLLFNYQDSPFRGEIYYKAKEMDMEFPKNLWHACLFYLCGRATQEALKTISVDHSMDMDVRNIFNDYDSSNFRSTLENYYLGGSDLEKTISILLSDLKNN